MAYFEKLHPWCIVRNLPNQDCIVVARFRRYHDATAYLQVLKKQVSNVKFVVEFNSQN